MYKKYLKIGMLGLCALAISACGSASSEDLFNSDIKANIVVSGDGSEIEVQANLTTLDVKFQNKPVRLRGGDQLLASIDGQVKVLYDTQAQELLDEGVIALFSSESTFFGRFNNNREGAEIVVTLDRESEDAYGIVTMPKPVFMSAPSSAEAFTAGDSISLVWSSGDPTRKVNIRIKSTCPLESCLLYTSPSPRDRG